MIDISQILLPRVERSGGIFTDRPFEPNIKCIIFALIVMLAYLYMGSGCGQKPNLLILPLLFIFSYVGLAVYDYIYQCNDKLYTGYSGLAGVMDSIFKPQRREPEPDIKLNLLRQKHLLPLEEQEKEYRKKVYLFHLIMVVGPLIYAGVNGVKSDERIFGYILGLGALAGLYHGTRIFFPR